MHRSAVFRAATALFLAATLSLFAQIPTPGSEGKLHLPWLQDFSAAKKKAEAEKKPLLLDITTDWCGWSKKMERETLADLGVQKALRSFVLVRLNPEASEANQKVAESYGTDGYPTFVVANFRGEQLGQQSGYMDARAFLEFLQRYQPLFKGNPLGYKSVQLDANDPLLKAIARIPAPESRPTSVGSFIVLDATSIQLQANGTAKFLTRTATYVADPDKGDLPEVATRYVSSRQKAKLKSVRILNTKGEGREVDIKLAKDEHAYSNQNVYWDVRTLSLELPSLKEGQILDVVEELEFQPIMPRQFYFRWNTGTKILLTSDLTITFPSSLNLQKRSVRCPTELEESQNADGTVTWRLKTSNPEPYEPALFSPPITDIWEGYEFYTPCTKDAIASWFAGLCRGRDTLPASARQKIAELKKANPTQTALLQAILDWVTKDIRYVSVAFGTSSHQPHPVGDTLGYLYGDCKDQSLLMQALCREAGIPASLVMLDAFGAGFNEESPAVEMFNHCILEATVDGKPCYVDPAYGPAKVGWVPETYAQSKALKVAGTSGVAVLLPAYQPRPDDSTNQTTVKLNPNGSGTVTEFLQVSGEKARELKKELKGTTPAKVRTYLEESYKRTGRKLLEFSMTDTEDPGNTYQSKISYTIPRYGSRTAGGLVFKLGAQSQHSDWISALNQSRTQPFRFRASDPATTSYSVELPAGAVLKSQPDDITIDTPFMQASRKLVFKDNTLSVTESFRLKEARLEAKEADAVYGAFRKLQDHRDYAFVVEMPTAK